MSESVRSSISAPGRSDSRSPRLPDFVRSLFWEYDDESLDWDRARDLIVRRVLSEGSWRAVMWLRSCVGDAELRRWIEAHEGRPLSPQQLRFWELILDLPQDCVNRWLQEEPRQIWANRTTR